MVEPRRIEPEGVPAALAEYSALRDEIVSIRSMQKSVTGIALTTYAAVFAIYAEGEQDELLVVVPPIGLVLCLLLVGETVQMTKVSQYIRTNIWAKLHTGYRSTWEDRRAIDWNAWPAALSESAVLLLILGGSLIALCVGEHGAGATVTGIIATSLTALATAWGLWQVRTLRGENASCKCCVGGGAA